MNTIKMNSVAEVISGYSFRTSLEDCEEGGIFVLQTSNIENSNIDSSNLPKTASELPRTKAYLKQNDVIISARGNLKAAYIDKPLPGPTVASSSVYIIRINSKTVLPAYLSIYLNSASAQRKLRKRLTGGVITTILSSDLNELEIRVPDLEIQKKISKLHKNWLDQKLILQKKLKLSEALAMGSINKLLTCN